MENLIAGLGFLTYIAILCMWWYKEVEKGEFDNFLWRIKNVFKIGDSVRTNVESVFFDGQYGCVINKDYDEYLVMMTIGNYCFKDFELERF